MLLTSSGWELPPRTTMFLTMAGCRGALGLSELRGGVSRGLCYPEKRRARTKDRRKRGVVRGSERDGQGERREVGSRATIITVASAGALAREF